MGVTLNIIFVLALASHATATVVNKCTNTTAPLPLNTDIIGCDASPCNFVTGTNVIAKVTFDSPGDIEILKPEVFAQAINVNINFPLNEKDGCKAMIGPQCPLEEGARATYQLIMPILSIYPKNIDLHLTFNLYAGEDKVSVACFEVDGRTK